MLIEPTAFGATPDDVRRHLAGQGIEARPTWKPMHLQPVYAGAEMVGGAVCEDLFRRGLCLPSGSALTASQQQRVVDAVLSTPRRSRCFRSRLAACAWAAADSAGGRVAATGAPVR